MPTLPEQVEMLTAAIAAQEALRPTLGDAAVDAAIAALRAQLRTLQERLTGTASPSAPHAPSEPSADKSMALLRSVMPREVADKMLATGRIEGERKQVTVVFADLAGFTALSETLDPEELTALTTEALQDLARAVYRFEGYIDKFIGDAVMAVFGVPIVHEDDAERALHAALAMREALALFNVRHAARLRGPLALHVGVNTGTVIAGNVGADLRVSYTVMGDTVNTASRLEGAAAAGQIFVSPDTFRLTSGAFVFLRHAPIALKGKREPLAVYELERARLLPGKTRGLQGLASAFVGRDEEMLRLADVVGALRAGRGSVVVVQGDAGLGKSRLMSEWRAAAAQEVRWVEGRCFANTTALSFGPFLDLMRRYAGIQGDQSDAEARVRLAEAVEQYFPRNVEAQAMFASLLALRLTAEEARILAAIPAQALRLKLFERVEELFAQLAGARPTVLEVEDLHWADETSLELLEHLLPLTARMPLAMVLVQRPWDPQRPSRLAHAIEAHHAARFIRLSLSPLSADASATMVEQLLSTRSLPERLRSTILAKAEGNPFFVEEVIRSLIDRGALVRSADAWIATALIDTVTVPDTLQGVLMSRLDRLPAETKWLAQQASVIGRIFLRRVLTGMAEAEHAIDQDLGTLQREDLIRERARDPELEYMFRHALTQETAYQSLLAPRRRELHRRVGQAMETIFADRRAEFASIIGEHYLRGEEWDKATEHLLQAGDAAAKLYAFSEARRLYEKALEALTHFPDGSRNRRQAETVVRFAAVSWMAVDPEATLGRLADAEALMAAAPDQLPGDRLLLARLQYWKGRLHSIRSELKEAIGYYRQVLAAAQDLGDAELLAIPATMIGRALVFGGQFSKATGMLQQAIRPLAETANWTEYVYTRGLLGACLAVEGKCRQGIAMARDALEKARDRRIPIGIVANLTFLGMARAQGLDLEEAFSDMRSAIALADQHGERVYVYTGRGILALIQSRLGQHQAAAESFAASREVARSLGGRLILSNFLAAWESEMHIRGGRFEEALSAAERTAQGSAAAGDLFSEGIAERCWAQAIAALRATATEEADAHFASSMRALNETGGRMEAALTQVAWGAVCRSRGNNEAAKEHLEAAARLYSQSGLPRDAWSRVAFAPLTRSSLSSTR